MPAVPPALFRAWVHAHEEDTAEGQVYRPADFPLPPSRGRRGFEFGEDGRAVYRGIGATDVPTAITGRWSDEGGRLLLTFDEERLPPIPLEVVSVDDQRLVVRRG